jgi:hypothetical protein
MAPFQVRTRRDDSRACAYQANGKSSIFYSLYYAYANCVVRITPHHSGQYETSMHGSLMYYMHVDTRERDFGLQAALF